MRHPPPLPTENLLEDTDGRRDEATQQLSKGDEAPHRRPLGAVACCSLFLLTRALLLMTSSQAMLIDSPATMFGMFHMINTKNPACGNSTDCPNTGWGPGTTAPLPRESKAPPGAKYSGLDECPCSTRRGDYRKTGKMMFDAGHSNKSMTYGSGCRPVETPLGNR